MDLHVLFMQRKEPYEDELGLSALVCIDEFDLGVEPNFWWDSKIAEEKEKYKDLAVGFAVVKISVDTYKIQKLCLSHHLLKGEIK